MITTALGPMSVLLDSPDDYLWASLVGLCVISIMFGWLVPRWVYKQTIADKDEQIRELRKAHEADRESIAKLATSSSVTAKVVEQISEAT
ncbi:hypothetical protein [Mycobacteroides abscessus]|uniref:hypothetical protein n=1 Tax=Mycobacteroides abscessus TaxID=36809 RepID=UPI0009286444|nr:hypothetical protein [Mycobacteroides abscessus]OTR12584.1 hypothetical protein B9M83_01335 [Mycobacteroides abscessus]OTR19117.1 hypothetical protein B9M82_01255 [Mycobacteroides abscessus]SIH59102.1 Uncharacterised protein [Mycobacteroides abscessus subsp. abscessus]SIN10460.1 Uncharacterised protein [Mycobacteroides abscessus subsp. abscessus]SIN11790.1 Uncharacterised protein [Mycobacteroides abscessus subsp. abscessus]